MDFSRHGIHFQCPGCGFFNEATLNQVRLRDVVICRGCKATLRLDARMNECRVALRQARAAIKQLEDSLGSLSITIKF